MSRGRDHRNVQGDLNDQGDLDDLPDRGGHYDPVDQDDLGLFADGDDGAPDAAWRDDADFDDERGSRGRRKRRFVTAGVIVVVVALLGGVGWFGLHEVLGIGYADYDGAGQTDVLVRVEQGASTSAIGATLAKDDVVASAHAFSSAGSGDSKVHAIQPGYYVMKRKMSGAAAVDAITDPANKVGSAEIRPGMRLDDTKLPSGKVRPGIFTTLAKASCAELDGESTCVSAEALRHVAGTVDPAALGVPRWAITGVKKAKPEHRLEGIIAPDLYQVRPGDSAQQILKSVLRDSALRWQADGMPSIAKGSGFTPYQLLIIASLSQSEAVQSDFGKVARVTYNRLAANHKLQYDSTINYVLDRPAIRTKPSDRAKTGAYNTYENGGLPPTPISAPGATAVKTAADPPAGKWMFFVKCHKNGRSCFAETGEQHRKNVHEAQARGAY